MRAVKPAQSLRSSGVHSVSARAAPRVPPGEVGDAATTPMENVPHRRSAWWYVVVAVALAATAFVAAAAAPVWTYALSLAPVTWVLISEIFPNRIRGAAVSVAVSALWIACFILTMTFPLLNAKLGAAKTFWLYAAICAAGFVFIRLRVPETKGKTLEQIEKELVD